MVAPLYSAAMGAWKYRKGIKRAAQFGYGAYKTYKRFKSSSSSASRLPATFQNDAVIIQQARRSTRRTRRIGRRVRKFQGRVRNAISASVPNSFSLWQNHFQMSGIASVLPSGIQSVGSVGICYGIDNGSAVPSDLSQIFTNESLGIASGSEDQIILRGAAFEMVVRSGADPVRLDMYECVPRSRTTFQSNAQDIFTQGLAQMTNIGGAPVSTDWGVTPFDVPNFVKFFKIIKTMRVQLGAGESTTVERTMKFRSKRVFGDDIANAPYMPGVSRVFLLIARGVPTSTSGQLSAYQANLRWNTTIHYEKWEPDNANRSKRT